MNENRYNFNYLIDKHCLKIIRSFKREAIIFRIKMHSFHLLFILEMFTEISCLLMSLWSPLWRRPYICNKGWEEGGKVENSERNSCHELHKAFVFVHFLTPHMASAWKIIKKGVWENQYFLHFWTQTYQRQHNWGIRSWAKPLPWRYPTYFCFSTP